MYTEYSTNVRYVCRCSGTRWAVRSPTFFSILHRCTKRSQETLQRHASALLLLLLLLLVVCWLSLETREILEFSAKTAGRNLEKCGGENGSGLARMVRGWRVWACRVLKAWFSLKHSVTPSKALIWAPFCLVAALTGANRMRRSNVRNRAACWHQPGFLGSFLRSFLGTAPRVPFRIEPLEN